MRNDRFAIPRNVIHVFVDGLILSILKSTNSTNDVHRYVYKISFSCLVSSFMVGGSNIKTLRKLFQGKFACLQSMLPNYRNKMLRAEVIATQMENHRFSEVS